MDGESDHTFPMPADDDERSEFLIEADDRPVSLGDFSLIVMLNLLMFSGHLKEKMPWFLVILFSSIAPVEKSMGFCKTFQCQSWYVYFFMLRIKQL